jgi:hypothetical protein
MLMRTSARKWVNPTRTTGCTTGSLPIGTSEQAPWGAYKARRKREEAAAQENVVKMLTQSQSKVREEPDFERSSLDLDSSRKSHLTHIYGEDDEMSAVNMHNQALRYHNLRQGGKE